MADVEKKTFDVVIVGAGILGLYTAYTMVKKGLRVLLLDQFQLPHKRGSSGGVSRIFRCFYDDDLHIRMAQEAHASWCELESIAKQELMKVTGTLSMYDGDVNRKILEKTSTLMKKHGLKHDVLTASEMKARFPQLNYSSTTKGLYDYHGASMMAVRCNRVLLSEFLKHGGTLRDAEQVTNITPGDVTTIFTAPGYTYKARNVVLTPGPWARDLLLSLTLNLPLKSLPAVPCYWKENVPGTYAPSTGMPIFVHNLEVAEGYQFIYGFPSMEYPGMMKVATRGEPALDTFSPDARDLQNKTRVIKQLSEYIQKHIPGLECKAPVITEACMYTHTPDGKFVIDRHPQHPNIFIACGGSGHAFKMAPIIGKLLSEMVTGTATSYDITPFSINRFKPASKI